MKSLEQVKTEYFQQSSQFVVLDQQGYWIASCHTLFSLKNHTASLFTTVPFLESMQEILKNLPEDESLSFPCIHAHLTGQEGYYDFVFKPYGAHILWIIYDFTDHYTELIPKQQERNEKAIEGELLRIQQKADALEKQLLQYKNEELERIQAAKTAFFSQVSHEMRTPLNSILGLAELISIHKTTDNTAYKEALQATARHLSSIVNDVLDLSKLEAGKMDVQQVPFHLTQTIKNVVNSFYYASQEKQIKIYYSIEKNIPDRLMGDPVRLSQVLYNLLGNAVKFTHEGCINVSVTLLKKTGNTCRMLFKVSDTGIGIAPENLEKIFTPYKQATADIYQLYGGTGLGLSIVKKIIELQGGTLSISSQEQQGTTISFDLTSTKNNEPEKEDLSHELVEFDHIKTALVGEDDPINQKVVENLLLRWSIQPTVVADGNEILEKLSDQTFDLLLIDQQMPRKTGVEIIQILHKRNISIPVILISGSAASHLLNKLPLHHIEALLEKPVTPPLLLEKIRALDKKLGQKSINLNYLKNITDNDTALMIDLINTFIDTMPDQIQEMKTLAANKDWASLYKTVHRAKPGFRYMGIKKLDTLISQLEENVQAGTQQETYEADIRQMEAITRQAVQELLLLKSALYPS